MMETYVAQANCVIESGSWIDLNNQCEICMLELH